MSTDNTVEVVIRTKRVLRVSNNSPLLAAREALEEVEREHGRISEDSFIVVDWNADGDGRGGRRYFHDLDQVRRAMP